MHTGQDRETFGRARLSFAREADVDEFVATLTKFEQGEITPEEWRAFRLLRGTYGQRQAADAQMLRVKVPQGILSREQLDALADVAERYSRGFGHITTRQNIQLHFLKLHDVEPAMRRLAEVGLTTREACGNSVRNITACPYAGVAGDEAFDVTPYAEALTRYLLRHPLSASLPRKFKIAFEGCPGDHIALAINDIGWQARVRTVDGRTQRGFRVTVAGGTSTLPRAGNVLYEFMPAGEMFEVAEAIVRVYHRLGDYKHKQRNRLKFLVRSLGWDAFKAEFERDLLAFRAEGGARLPFDPDTVAGEEPPTGHRPEPPAPLAIAARAATTTVVGPGIVPRVEPQLVVDSDAFARWSATNLRVQKQPGWATVVVTTVLGDLTSAQLRLIGELAEGFSDGDVRVTHDQNFVFRWVRSDDVRELYRSLAAAGLARPGAGTLADVTSCPGAESCKLAVTQSRGLGRLLIEELYERQDLVREVPGLNIKISGCPNGCGQHHVAGIGFQGSLRKIGGRPAPHYFVMVGGGATDAGTSFGRHAMTIPARRGGVAVERLVQLFRDQHAPGESALGFFQRVDLAVVKGALQGLDRLTPEDADPQDFIDLAEETAFDPSVQEGECSA
ncbi:MAG TPA: nitrite/sulfite reductase [Vicinamibacterales bacterium]|jgi:sulfite reductase (NADPH) hemoprotein beta-component|nr:nitrite/sulfite reductase [Vicinamibacterales bacterium]